jgi:predicted TIM-barrel enzyme
VERTAARSCATSAIGAGNRLLFSIVPEAAVYLAGATWPGRRSTAFNHRPDAICSQGWWRLADRPGLLRRVKEAYRRPVFTNTGVRLKTWPNSSPSRMGRWSGQPLKSDGRSFENHVDESRVGNFWKR